jgi:predicted dehydrogenase
MAFANLLRTESDEKVRYAIVGVGDIAQEDMMPGVEHTGNSEITALVTSDEVKAEKVGEKYSVKATYSYEQFEAALSSGLFDAIYLSTPNWRHAEFIIPALRAGIHVLTEKPLEVSTAKCREILKAKDESEAKLMVAYRLHFEPGTLDTIDKIRSGMLGDVHLFASTFTQLVDPANHRVHHGELSGPVMDMGPYPVNAARYVFEDEPEEVISAVGTKHRESGFAQDFFDTVAVTLRFPGNRLAQFNLSYFGNPANSFVAVGPKGTIQLNPAYTFGRPIRQVTVIGEKEAEQSFKNTDHFGGEMKYFSQCILNNEEPEPNAEEGFADVRVLEAILQALESGRSIPLGPATFVSFRRDRRIDTKAQRMTLRAVSTPELVHASNPGRGAEKKAKN